MELSQEAFSQGADSDSQLLPQLGLALKGLSEWLFVHARGNVTATADAWDYRLDILLGDAVAAGLAAESMSAELQPGQTTKQAPDVPDEELQDDLPPANNMPQSSGKGRLATLLHLGLLIPVPIIALLLLHPESPNGAVRANDDRDREIAERVLRRPFLTSDLEEIAATEKAMSRLQNTRYQQLSELDALATSKDRKAGSPLNLWDRIGRTARRHKATLDYFLGFPY